MKIVLKEPFLLKLSSALAFLWDKSKKTRAARRGESAEKGCFGTKLRFDGERGTVFGRRTAQRRSSHSPETFVARPRDGRRTAQRRTAHGPRSLTGIRDGAAQHGRQLGRSTVAHFARKVRGAKMKVRRQLNSLHYSP